MTIWTILSNAAVNWPSSVAVICGAKNFTYQQLEHRAKSLAAFFVSQGIQKGDAIAIVDVNSHEYLEVYFGAAAVGAIVCPINHRLSRREVDFILNDSRAKLVLARPSFKKLVPQDSLFFGESYEAVIEKFDGESLEPVWVKDDDVAQIYYTSGTTGKPKGVMLTHKNVCLHAGGTIGELALSQSDVWGHIAPMFHLADAWACFAITQVGGCHVMVPRFAASIVLEVIEKQRITISNLIPTMLNLMIKDPQAGNFDYSSLRVILSGGAPIAPDVVRGIMETFGCDYIQTYGMTETSPYLTMSILAEHLKKLSPEKQLHYKSRTGRPFITIDLKVVDDNGCQVTADDKQVGEIWVRGETITPGYWNLPKETEAAFCDGWLKTGDLAVIDSEGYVNIVDRKKDMIITGGENVYSTEVENVLYTHPAVLEAAVFGVPDEKWGEMVSAAVVVKKGTKANATELIAFCKEKLASYKTPRKITFLKELPKTGSGKIYKKSLRHKSLDS